MRFQWTENEAKELYIKILLKLIDESKYSMSDLELESLARKAQTLCNKIISTQITPTYY